jgi:hypothetical protein
MKATTCLETEERKSSSDDREILKRVRDTWTGVCGDINNYLLGSRQRTGTVSSGSEGWRLFRFRQLAVVDAMLDPPKAQPIAITRSQLARAGGDGTRSTEVPTWDRLLMKWYRSSVEIKSDQ